MIGNPFKKRIMFSVDSTLPDPIELKFRFRRRIMFLTFFGAIILLAIPVARERIPKIKTSIASRLLAEQFLSSQLLSAQNKTAVTLKLNESNTWMRTLHDNTDCNATSRTPPQPVFSGKTMWKITLNNQEIKAICIHPIYGLIADGKPINNQHIDISAYTILAENNKNVNYGLRARNSGIHLFNNSEL